MKTLGLVFILGELQKDKNEIWVKRLDQYRVACMKMLTGKRQRVDRPELEEALGPKLKEVRRRVSHGFRSPPQERPSNKCQDLGEMREHDRPPRESCPVGCPPRWRKMLLPLVWTSYRWMRNHCR